MFVFKKQESTTRNIIPKNEMLKDFPSETRNRTKIPAVTTFLQHCSEGSSQYNSIKEKTFFKYTYWKGKKLKTQCNFPTNI